MASTAKSIAREKQRRLSARNEAARVGRQLQKKVAQCAAAAVEREDLERRVSAALSIAPLVGERLQRIRGLEEQLRECRAAGANGTGEADAKGRRLWSIKCNMRGREGPKTMKYKV